MKFPGFTAEASLGRSAAQYQTTPNRTGEAVGHVVASARAGVGARCGSHCLSRNEDCIRECQDNWGEGGLWGNRPTNLMACVRGCNRSFGACLEGCTSGPYRN